MWCMHPMCLNTLKVQYTFGKRLCALEEAGISKRRRRLEQGLALWDESSPTRWFHRWFVFSPSQGVFRKYGQYSLLVH